MIKRLLALFILGLALDAHAYLTPANLVTTVFTRSGNVTAQSTDYSAFYLQKSFNLSDLLSAPTARGNLGLGSASTHAATDFQLAIPSPIPGPAYMDSSGGLSSPGFVTYPKGTLTTGDIGKFLMADSGVAKVYAQDSAIPGQYNTWTFEFNDFPQVGIPEVWTVTILAIPTIGEYIEFNGGSPNVVYGQDWAIGMGWEVGLTTNQVAANLVTAWNQYNPAPHDGNSISYTAVASGSTVTFTANGYGAGGGALFQWEGDSAHVTTVQTQNVTYPSAVYFQEFSTAWTGDQEPIYGVNWAVGATLNDVAANYASAWNALSPAPFYQHYDKNVNPDYGGPWVAITVGAIVTLTQSVFGDPGTLTPTADNYTTPPTYTNVLEGNDYVAPASNKQFLGTLYGINGGNALIENKSIFSGIASGPIVSAGNHGLISIVDGIHVMQQDQSINNANYSGSALFDAADGETFLFRAL